MCKTINNINPRKYPWPLLIIISYKSIKNYLKV